MVRQRRMVSMICTGRISRPAEAVEPQLITTLSPGFYQRCDAAFAMRTFIVVCWCRFIGVQRGRCWVMASAPLRTFKFRRAC